MHPAQVMAQAIVALSRAGVVSPRADARLLLMHVTGDDGLALALRRDIDDQHVATYQELVDARCRHIPLQHLTGRTYFRRISVKVGPGVFIPRPETEMVVGKAIELLGDAESPLVVDLCAGSGVISAAILDEVDGARVVAIEKSVAAADYLRANLAGERATIVVQDIAQAYPLPRPADLVVANPPYLVLSERDRLPEEVRDHDPDLALFGGEDGLSVFPLVATAAATMLRPGGWLVVEHGDDQAGAVMPILDGHGFAQISSHVDLAGRDRFITARYVRGWHSE